MRPRFSLHARRISTPTTILTLSVAILFLSGCAALGGGVSQTRGDNEQTSSEEPTASGEPTMPEADESTNDSGGGPDTVRAGDAEVITEGGSVVVRAGDAEVTTGAGGAVARAGDVVAESGVGNGGGSGDSTSPENAELRLAGEEGTSFSGVCVVGGEPTTLEGEVPARLDYELTGGGLACEIGKEGPGLLRVVLTAGDSEVVRETNAEDAKIEIVYQNGNIIASTASESGASSSVSSSSTSVSSSSSVQNQSSSSSINQSVSVTN